jgi:beta-aspartyl-dipeptidase (metallo-type)
MKFELYEGSQVEEKFFKLIKNVEVFAPESLGPQNVLVAGGKIVGLDNDQHKLSQLVDNVQIIDGEGNYLVPGFIDAHVHMLGGGGGAGYGSRAPELQATEAFLAGTTTIVGCLGIDTVTRTPLMLLAKARSLQQRNLSVYCVIGGFQLPPQTICGGDIRKDMFIIPEMLGVGEPAISDARSNKPSQEYLMALVSEIHNAGRVSGKRGVVQFHLGDASSGIQPLLDILPFVPIKHILPLHFNRNEQLMAEAPKWAEKGGYVDLTSPLSPPQHKRGVIVSKAIKQLKEKGVDPKFITVSTDGNGVSTLFGLAQIERFPLNLLYKDFKGIVDMGINLPEALGYVSTNISDALGIAERKGRIKIGLDADMLILERKTLDIRTVISVGHLVVDQGERVNKARLDG